MKKVIIVFIFLLFIGSFVSAGVTQTGKATLVVECDEDCQHNQDYSSNITGEVIENTENRVSLISIIIDFFKNLF